MTPPLSLRVSVTDRCLLHCAYCAPEAVLPKRPRAELLSYEEIATLISVLRESHGLEHVRLTGGEPLVRPGIEKLVAILAAIGIHDLALTTNAQLLAGKAHTLKEAGLKRVNISLDSLNPATYQEITRGGVLSDTLAGIAAARQAGLEPLKLNSVVIRGRNDHEAAGLVRFALDHSCQVRFLELMPIGSRPKGWENGFIPSSEVRHRLLDDFTLSPLPVDPDSTSRNYIATDTRGRTTIVGFVSPRSEPFCGACRRLRVTATGLLIGCLARPEGIPLAPLLRPPDPDAIGRAVMQALGSKRRDDSFRQTRQMVEIGG